MCRTASSGGSASPGELSYEVHVPSGHALHVWETLLETGADLGCAPFGVEAQRILRLEKGHYIVGQDTDGLSKAPTAGLGGLVKLDKPDTLGPSRTEARLRARRPPDPGRDPDRGRFDRSRGGRPDCGWRLEHDLGSYHLESDVADAGSVNLPRASRSILVNRRLGDHGFDGRRPAHQGCGAGAPRPLRS